MEKDKDKKSAEKEKSELVAEAIAKIEKQYGKGSIIMSDVGYGFGRRRFAKGQDRRDIRT